MNRAFVVSTSTGLNFCTSLGHIVTDSGNSRPCGSCWPALATDHMFPGVPRRGKGIVPTGYTFLGPSLRNGSRIACI